MPRYRLAYLVTHPIQYQAPLLRTIAAEPDLDLQVFFRSDFSVGRFQEADFGREIEWDVPLLEGYKYAFLPALGARTRATFWRPFNYGLSRRLATGGFDALWIHGYARPFHWQVAAAAKRHGLKVLIRDEATAISTRRGPVKQLAKRAFFGALRRLCDGFLAIGALNRGYYLENDIPAERIFSMPYAVDNAYFQAGAAQAAAGRAKLRAELGLEPDRPVILFAARFTPRKRPGDLLEAVARLAEDPGVATPHLLFAGDGPLRPELERRAAEVGLGSVRFLGFRGQLELPALYDLCDVFVLPSVFEPWGLVVNEAMNAGRAVVVSDQVGCGPDLVEPGVNGHLFKAGDVGALRDALARLVADPEACRAMGRRSLEIINRWSFREDVEGLKAALAFVLREPQRGPPA